MLSHHKLLAVGLTGAVALTVIDPPPAPENPLKPEKPETPEPLNPENPEIPDAPLVPENPEIPEAPEKPLIPDWPVIPMFQEARVPEPPIKSTLTVSVVVVYAVITPSMKLAGVTVFATRTLLPTAKALADMF